MVLRIGTAGVPLSAKSRDTLEGISRVRELNLDAMELEFVRQVYVKNEEDARKISSEARKNDIVLSVHAPYFINMNSPEKETIEASRKRIFDSAKMGYYCGARSIVIHSAFYLKMDRKEVYERVKNEYKIARKEVVENGLDGVFLRPELMGKASQFADIDELARMCSEIEGVLPCVDFAHYVALHGEKVNNYDGFCKPLELIEKHLGKEALNNMHIHFSGIEYTEKGERRHLIFGEGTFKWQEMVRAWKDFKISGVAISESPNIEEDALKAKELYVQ